MNLLPREEKFFDLFNQHVQMLCQSSRLLVSGLNGGYQGMCSVEKEMETEHLELLADLLERAEARFKPSEFRRYGSARHLYNFHVDHAGEY